MKLLMNNRSLTYLTVFFTLLILSCKPATQPEQTDREVEEADNLPTISHSALEITSMDEDSNSVELLIYEMEDTANYNLTADERGAVEDYFEVATKTCKDGSCNKETKTAADMESKFREYIVKSGTFVKDKKAAKQRKKDKKKLVPEDSYYIGCGSRKASEAKLCEKVPNKKCLCTLIYRKRGSKVYNVWNGTKYKEIIPKNGTKPQQVMTFHRVPKNEYKTWESKKCECLEGGAL